MGKSDYNPLNLWRGRVGGIVYRVSPRGRQVIQPYVRHEQPEPTPEQLRTQARFALAQRISHLFPADILRGLAVNRAEARGALVSNIFNASTVSESTVGNTTTYTAALAAAALKISKGFTAVPRIIKSFDTSTLKASIEITPNSADKFQKAVVILLLGLQDQQGNMNINTLQYKIANISGATTVTFDITTEHTFANIYCIPLALNTDNNTSFDSLIYSDTENFSLSAIDSITQGNLVWGESIYGGQLSLS